MKQVLAYFNKPVYKHVLFWVAVFLFYTTPAIERYGIEEVFATYFFNVLYQIITAYTILYLIIPNYRKNKSIVWLLVSLFLLFFLMTAVTIFVRISFLEKVYPNCFEFCLDEGKFPSFIERISNLKASLIPFTIFYLQPLFFLVALSFYENQYKLSKISEQKKTLELKTLKHQLNPHFLFNTLNNLYALSVKKSDKAPDVIEKLSDILDYVVYGSNKEFVPIQKEIDLIENYLALEQVRYEDRVLVSFRNSISENYKIAPLLLLTFIENAFKHGVSQELKMATVRIYLSTVGEYLIFNIHNSKPDRSNIKITQKESIGLSNVEQQLKLLYPDTHNLKIEENSDSFSVKLKLKWR